MMSHKNLVTHSLTDNYISCDKFWFNEVTPSQISQEDQRYLRSLCPRENPFQKVIRSLPKGKLSNEKNVELCEILEKFVASKKEKTFYSGEVSSDSFETTIHKYSEFKQLLQECLDETSSKLDKIRSVLQSREDQDLSNFLFSAEDYKRCQVFINEKPIVMVIGQVNSGKSTLINQILGHRYLPTSDLPCTARIVKVGFSNRPFVRINNESGDCIMEESVPKKKTLRKLIALEGSSREDEKLVNQTVEVGLNCELLRNGLQILDAPGLSENEVLNNVIEMLPHQNLQLMVYVIDGNKSINEMDRTFLCKIRVKAPKMKIIFVCNKAEEDEEATAMDRASDDESESEITRVNFIDKGTWTFGNLKKFDLIDKNLEIHNCDNYFVISCKRVKLAVHKKEINEYTINFDALLRALSRQFKEKSQLQLETTVKQLGLSQKTVFDFCISNVSVRWIVQSELKDKLKQIRSQEDRFYKNTRQSLHTESHELLKSLKQSIESQRSNIISKVKNMSFRPIYIKMEIERNCIINNCRQQILDFIVMYLNNEIMNNPSPIWDSFAANINMFIDDLVESCSPFQEHLREHIKFAYQFSYMFQFDTINFNDVINERIVTMLSKRFENIKATIVGFHLNPEWKENTGKAIINAIDINKLVASRTNKMLQYLDQSHLNFLEFIRVVEHLFNYRNKLLPNLIHDHRVLISEFGELICKTDALLNVITQGCYSDLSGEKMIYEGSRSQLYSCKKNSDIIFKRSSSLKEIYVSNNIMRLENHNNLLKSYGTSLDESQKVILLLPYMPNGTLFHLLLSSDIKQVALSVLVGLYLQIVEVSLYMAKKNIQIEDLRANNILLTRNDDGSFHCKINILKAMSLTAPYPKPDNKIPFHFAPEVYKKSNSNSIHQHTVYSLGVLFSFIVMRSFTRPKCLLEPCVSTVEQISVKVNKGEVRNDIIQNIANDEMKAMKDLIKQMLEIDQKDRLELRSVYSRVDAIHQELLSRNDA